MNILTYASPVSITPHRMWSISLYKGTLSHENFVREKMGVLQLLAPEHANCVDTDGRPGALIRVLGGTSGKDVNKRLQCEKLGYAWSTFDDKNRVKSPPILPRCMYCLQLELEGDMIDCGSHDVALCRVVSMIADDHPTDSAPIELDYLSTRKLRQMGIISELGRIADTIPESE